MSSVRAHRKAYSQIGTLLIQERSSLANFPTMPQIADHDDVEDDMLPVEHLHIGQRQYEQLNSEQRTIVESVRQTVLNRNSFGGDRYFFIDGPGGSGKTFIYTTLYHLLKGDEKVVCTMAFTGIAATLLPQGKTVHRTFKLPIAIYNDSSPTIKVQSQDAKYLQSVDLFIWDEAPMAPRHALELVDRTLRDIMNSTEPFGGKIMILGGDFRQLLPVKKFATRSELVDLSIKYSPIWPSFSQFSLTKNMRTLPEEIEFAAFLLSVGDGTVNIEEFDICLPDHCLALPDADIAEDLYGEVIRNHQYEKLTEWAILSARNVDVEDINKRVVQLLDSYTEKIFTSINTVSGSDNGDIAETLLPEYLETLNPPSLPPHELRLRVNSVVMLIRNLSINEGLCNGTRLQVLEFSNHLLKCKILTGDKSGEMVFINRITLYSEDNYPFTFGRRQFPVKLAFAMTINKSQGQTFERIGIDLRKDIFNHGQLYVALSRVRSWDSLKIYLGAQRESNVVKNYVYKELYQ
ncbi:ATP-dependent DNA helicase PIF1-like [Fopius arisanus]|uniref:ATP-dependent DNA helicase n=1 Tax=Fopius arisanus TaxID=64838 RepID=A0A9R1TQ91_9HYME|nr:PREDICTED: ATP-dependent DNA helicase PIF1-like [Fopius arisanus]